MQILNEKPEPKPTWLIFGDGSSAEQWFMHPEITYVGRSRIPYRKVQWQPEVGLRKVLWEYQINTGTPIFDENNETITRLYKVSDIVPIEAGWGINRTFILSSIDGNQTKLTERWYELTMKNQRLQDALHTARTEVALLRKRVYMAVSRPQQYIKSSVELIKELKKAAPDMPGMGSPFGDDREEAQ